MEMDSGWKEILEEYFPEFLEFFFPAIHTDLDLSNGYEFLDKEFQEIVKDNELGKRYADKLVKVFLRTGEEKWLLIHIEIQGFYDVSFAKRMYIYNYRIFDKFDREVISLAVLADESESFRPNTYQVSRWGFEYTFSFPVIKLLDYRNRIEELEQSRNPFSIVVLTHLHSLDSRKDVDKKLFWKITLVKSLFQKGFSKREIRNLYRFIDWIIGLPKDLELKFRETLAKEQEPMPYVTNLERIAKEEGMQQGLQQGLQQGIQQGIFQGLLRTIELGLKLKFGTEGLRLLPEIIKISDTAVLEAIVAGVETAAKPDELRRIYTS